jgi:hypothetical protein
MSRVWFLFYKILFHIAMLHFANEKTNSEMLFHSQSHTSNRWNLSLIWLQSPNLSHWIMTIFLLSKYQEQSVVHGRPSKNTRFQEGGDRMAVLRTESRDLHMLGKALYLWSAFPTAPTTINLSGQALFHLHSMVKRAYVPYWWKETVWFCLGT